jgi:hypothetical protein
MTPVPGGKEPDIVRVLVSRVSLIVARPRHIHLADDTVGPMTMVYLPHMVRNCKDQMQKQTSDQQSCYLSIYLSRFEQMLSSNLPKAFGRHFTFRSVFCWW